MLCILIVPSCELLFDTDWECSVTQGGCADCDDDECMDYPSFLEVIARGEDEADDECLAKLGMSQVDTSITKWEKCNLHCLCDKFDLIP